MRCRDYMLTVAVSVVIVVLSTIPIPENPPLGDVPLIDKWVHFVMYGGLSFTMCVDRARQGHGRVGWWYALLMLVYPSALGGAMELVQAYWTTCRSGDMIDFWADVLGAVLGTLLALATYRLWKEKISALR